MKRDLRHFIRPVVPSTIYRLARDIANVSATINREGLGLARRLRQLEGNEATLNLRSLAHPFHLKLERSHIDGLVQNVFRSEYDALLRNPEPATIIDAGCFIGDLSCHWATRFPSARILALEPNSENHSYAITNISLYQPKIELLKAGLWSRCCSLKVSGTDMGSTVCESQDPQNSVPAFDIPFLMTSHQLKKVDILKLDIEGAEANVLDESCRNWIDLVGELVVEMHGSDIEAEIVNRLSSLGFSARRRRSLVFFHRN